jgi:biopolymer transport protein ExbD
VSTTLAEINVIPLVDVMLVLLIIFMVTAPMLQRSVEVNLPVASRAAPVSSERLYVDVPLSFRKDGNVFIEREPVRLAFLGERLKQLFVTRTDRQVFLRIDGQLSVQQMLQIGDQLMVGGAENFGVVADPPKMQ